MKITIEYPDDMDIRDVTYYVHDVTVFSSFEEDCPCFVGLSYENEAVIVYKHTGTNTRRFTVKWAEEKSSDEQVLSE